MNNHRHVYARRKKTHKKPKISFTNTAFTPYGSRIINIKRLGEYINAITQHSGGTITLTGEKRHGLASILSNKCSHKISFSTSKGPRGMNQWESNLAAVWSQMVTGGGHTSLTNTMGVIGVLVMAKWYSVDTSTLRCVKTVQ